MLAGPVSAGATTFCVSDVACVTAGGTASTDLGAALSSANSNAGPDRVEVGVGSFDEDTGGPYFYGGTDPLELVGEGTGQTVLFDSTPAMFDPVLAVNGTSTTVSGFTFEVSSNTQRGAQLSGGSSGSNLEARLGGGASPTGVIGFLLTGLGAESLSHASTDLVAGDGSLGINVIGTPGATIEDVQLSAESGIFLGLSDASAENVIRRARITATDGIGVTASLGSTTLESSLVQVLTPNDIGVVVGNSNMAVVPFDIEVRNTTIIGPGTGVSATGASVGAANTAGAQLPALTLRDSIVSGFQRPLECSDQSTMPPGDDDFPTLTTDYSDYPSTGVSISTGCMATFTETNHLTAGPMFVNPASDFHLQMTSPLIDAGTPGPLGGSESPTDLDGNPRLVDGNGDNTARRDLGAYELQPPPPPGGGATPAALPRSFFGDLALRALKKKRRLAGALSSDNPACLLGRLIELFRVRKGPDPRVGTASTQSDGSFRLGRRLAPGRYYGEVDPLSLPGGDSCAADLSAKARLKSPPPP
jgi:hypothetical protein